MYGKHFVIVLQLNNLVFIMYIAFIMLCMNL